MDIFDSLSSPGMVLNEQIARQIFDIIPEQGPVVIITDRDGHCWPSDSEKFAGLDLSETFLKQLCAKIDDGDEPVVSQVSDFSIIATQLATEHTDCGYVIIALPQYSPESSLINIDLIEMLLNQFGLIAKLIEKNTQLYELQVRHFSSYTKCETASN